MSGERRAKDRPSGWGLYWVASDGFEDCFVVARNSRSAKRIERDTNGFGPALYVERVAPIATSVERAYRRRCTKDPALPCWPWYADHWLLMRLGAQFRAIDGLTETLLNDTVYTSGGEPRLPRLVGEKFVRAFRKDPQVAGYLEEDSYAPSQITLLTMLGICVARCQEIEHLMAHSFILGLSDAQTGRYEKINDLISHWKKLTLGQMLHAVDKGYEVDPMLRANLSMFLDMRNELVHGLTTSPRYDIQTAWGEAETVAFLVLFDFASRVVRKAFKASLYASIDYGNRYMFKKRGADPCPLSRREEREAGLFAAFFTPRMPLDDGPTGGGPSHA